MRCKSCEYPLFGIESRQCPECGEPFKPSDFELKPNAVRFLCPHCRQHYFGTSADGHLIPRAFDCVSCGQHIDMDEMVLAPAEGLKDDDTIREQHPWLSRKRIGYWKARFKTLFYAMILPARLIRLTPVDSSGRVAVSFGLSWLGVALLLGALVPIAIMTLVFVTMGVTGAIIPAIGGLVGTVGGAFIAAVAYILLWAVSCHAILKLTGGTAHSLKRTFQCIGYASAAHIPIGFPCVGFYVIPVAWIWPVVSASIMLTVGQRVHWLRATIAATVLPLALVGGGSTLAIIWMVNTANAAAHYQLNTVQTWAPPISSALASSNPWPDHAAHLITNPQVTASNFVDISSSTIAADIPLFRDGETPASPNVLTLQDVENMPDADRQQFFSEMAPLPVDVVAHRVGDIVFTYHGIDRSAHPADLWLFIVWHNPVAALQYGPPNTQWSPMQYTDVVVAKLDGTFEEVGVAFDPQWTRALQRQNALRATVNLPPIPDPETVTHEQPAVAP